ETATRHRAVEKVLRRRFVCPERRVTDQLLREGDLRVEGLIDGGENPVPLLVGESCGGGRSICGSHDCKLSGSEGFQGGSDCTGRAVLGPGVEATAAVSSPARSSVRRIRSATAPGTAVRAQIPMGRSTAGQEAPPPTVRS